MGSFSVLASFDRLSDLMAAFPDEQTRVDHFRAIRWCNGEFASTAIR